MEINYGAVIDLEKRDTIAKKRIMIAGVGNMFMKDDGFGGRVVSKLKQNEFPEGVEIKDFGTGGLKLAYDLMKGYDLLLLLDVSKRGGRPGTLYLIEANESEVSRDLTESPIDPHGCDPMTIFRFLRAIGSWPGKVLIIACEPEDIEDFQIGLSEHVNASVDKAVEFVKETVGELFANPN